MRVVYEMMKSLVCKAPDTLTVDRFPLWDLGPCSYLVTEECLLTTAVLNKITWLSAAVWIYWPGNAPAEEKYTTGVLWVTLQNWNKKSISNSLHQYSVLGPTYIIKMSYSHLNVFHHLSQLCCSPCAEVVKTSRTLPFLKSLLLADVSFSSSLFKKVKCLCVHVSVSRSHLGAGNAASTSIRYSTRRAWAGPCSSYVPFRKALTDFLEADNA